MSGLWKYFFRNNRDKWQVFESVTPLRLPQVLSPATIQLNKYTCSYPLYGNKCHMCLKTLWRFTNRHEVNFEMAQVTGNILTPNNHKLTKLEVVVGNYSQFVLQTADFFLVIRLIAIITVFCSHRWFLTHNAFVRRLFGRTYRL